jgi:hypothetical protein
MATTQKSRVSRTNARHRTKGRSSAVCAIHSTFEAGPVSAHQVNAWYLPSSVRAPDESEMQESCNSTIGPALGA